MLELRVKVKIRVRVMARVRDAWGTKRLGTKRLEYEMSFCLHRVLTLELALNLISK